MRFTKKRKLYLAYLHNHKKQVTKFLWWPITINYENRWLETATIQYSVDYEDGVLSGRTYYWKAVGFVDKSE